MMIAPTRILFVHYGQDWIRGSEQCLLDLVTHLDRSRFSVMVACNHESLAQAVRAVGVQAVVTDAANPSPLIARAEQVRALQQIAAAFSVQIIHANSSVFASALVRVARSLHVPLLVQLHIVPNAAERRHELLHQASLIVGVSQHSVDGFVEDGMRPDRVTVVHNAVDGERLSRGDARGLRASLGIPDDAFVAATVGSLIPRKAHDVAIRAIAHARTAGREFHLLVCGSGDEEDTLQQLAVSLAVGHLVHFLGFRDDVGAILRDAANVLLAPSSMEAFPLNVLEAQWLGIPVIASAIPAHAEALLDHEAMLFPPEDFQALAQQLISLSNNKRMIDRAKTLTKIRAARHFSMGRYVARFEGLYAHLAQMPRRRHGWIGASRWPRAYTRWLVDAVVKRTRGSSAESPASQGTTDTESFRVFESVRGKGTAWLDETQVAEVAYALKDTQEVLAGVMGNDARRGEQSALGERSVFGVLRLQNAGVLAQFIGVGLRLELEDGRVLPFTVTKHLDARSCLIQGLGTFA